MSQTTIPVSIANRLRRLNNFQVTMAKAITWASQTNLWFLIEHSTDRKMKRYHDKPTTHIFQTYKKIIIRYLKDL